VPSEGAVQVRLTAVRAPVPMEASRVDLVVLVAIPALARMTVVRFGPHWPTSPIKAC
jgi:hypothetical protein